MRIWKNTNTLEGLIDDLQITQLKEEAELALLGSKPINLHEFPKVKGIFRAGVSKTNIPLEEAKIRNISVCLPSEKTKNYIYEETANFTCGLIFKYNYSHLGTIEPWKKYNRTSLSKKTLLIIGEGCIGKKVKNKMSRFLDLLIYDPCIYPKITIESLLPKADFISIHIPDIKNNIDFIDSKKLSLMKKNALLINTSRGRIVNEEDLYCELIKKRIFAAFDVYWKEPYSGKLKEFYPNRFMMTPHVASTCDEFLKGSANDLKQFILQLKKI